MSSLLHLEDVGEFLRQDKAVSCSRNKLRGTYPDDKIVSLINRSISRARSKSKLSKVAHLLSDKCLSSLAAKLDSPEIYCSPSNFDVSNDGDYRDSQNDVNKENPVKNVGTITDVCCSSDIAEVEIISLIEEQIPKYKLRADQLTQFSGYENEDWFIGNPVLPPDENLDLTDEQIGETFDYFLLCTERLSQMTKTYNDIDAVTELLAEKEKDLELAARIGQSLLNQKNDVKLKNKQLEAELASANDKVVRLHEELYVACETVTQLRHDLSVKTGLLQIYTQDLEHSESDSPVDTPLHDRKLSFSNWDCVNEKVRVLEDENRKLKEEAADLYLETETLEAKENQLVSECVRELSETNFQVRSLAEELAKKAEDNIRQQEEITNLLSQVVELQRKIRTTSAQNEELESHVLAAQETERELTDELIDLKEKYDEVLEMLQEAREELKKHRKKSTPRARAMQCGSSGVFSNFNSLASEIESCLSHDSDFGDSYSSDDRKSHSSRVFDTVRRAKSKRHLMNESTESTPGHRIYRPSRFANKRNDKKASDSESVVTDESLSMWSESNLASKRDLENALSKLSLRRRTEHEYQMMKHEKLINEGGLEANADGYLTPDSIMSTGSRSGAASYWPQKRRYHYPDKLQIVKPLEGSATLLQWRKLATPHMGGLSEVRLGVQMKGEVKAHEPNEVYSLSDFEEEEDCSYHPGKAFVDTSSIYTFTMSTIMHPSHNQVQLTSSVPTTQINTTFSLPATTCSAVMSSKVTKSKTEKAPSNYYNKSGTSTFSTNSSLAKLLQERPNISSSVKSDAKSNKTPGAWPSMLTNTLDLLRISSMPPKLGISSMESKVSQSPVNSNIGLGLLSMSAVPRSVYTRTMISSETSNTDNSDVSNPVKVSKRNEVSGMDSNVATCSMSSGLNLDLLSCTTPQMTCINPSSPQEYSPSAAVGTLNSLTTLRKGGLIF